MSDFESNISDGFVTWLSDHEPFLGDISKTSTSKHRIPVYKPLPKGDFLRLLVVQPGTGYAELVCHLTIQTQKRSRNKYAAISYVWGDPEATEYISCNGRRVQITRNLADALRRFRHPRTTRRLWADALCINQADIEEKGVQVGKIGSVFRDATKVLVWLGQDHKLIAEDCFRMIESTNEYLGELFRQHNEEYASMPQLKAPYPIPVDKVTWSRVLEMVGLDWFFRAWVVQECALAKECRMYWGSSHINVADVFEIAVWCGYYVDLYELLRRHEMSACGGPLTDFESIHCHYGEGHRWQSSRPGLLRSAQTWSVSSLTMVLHYGRRFETTDPRDHVFAFLECPFAKNENGEPILKPDYSLTDEQVWHQTACTLLKHPREGPWVLSAVGHKHRDVLSDFNRPSWVPYWSEDYDNNVFGDPAHVYKAGGPIKLFTARPHRGMTLEVSGFIFDCVAWKSPALERDDFTLQQFEDPEGHIASEPAIETLWRCASLAAENLGFVLDEDVFTMTLVGGGAHPSKHFTLERHRERFGSYCHLVRSQYRGIDVLNSESAADQIRLSDAISVMDELKSTVRNRSIFLTRDGRLGLGGAALIEIGDLCCIFNGVSVPFLLTPAANQWHKLIGECYVHGVMHGQLLESYRSGSIFLE